MFWQPKCPGEYEVPGHEHIKAGQGNVRPVWAAGVGDHGWGDSEDLSVWETEAFQLH